MVPALDKKSDETIEAATPTLSTERAPCGQGHSQHAFAERGAAQQENLIWHGPEAKTHFREKNRDVLRVISAAQNRQEQACRHIQHVPLSNLFNGSGVR
jgi:hypothetical protein